MTGTEQPVNVAPPRWRAWIAPLSRIPTPLIFGLSVAIALVVLWFEGSLRKLVDVIGDANFTLLIVAAPVYVASLGLLCYRWHVLVRMAQGKSDLARAAEAFLTSVVINYAAPIGLAVPSRAALTKRALGLDARATGTIAVWEIGVDVIVLGAGTLLWLFLANGSTSAVGGELSESIRTYAIAGIALVTIAAMGAGWFLRTADRRTRLFESGKRILLAPRDRPAEAALALATTTGYWAIQGVVLALLVTAFGVDSSFEFVLGLTTLPILVGMLSPIPGGAVVREALMYAVARLANVPGDPVIAAALVYRIALFAAIPILYGIARWRIARRRVVIPSSDHHAPSKSQS